MVGPLAPPAAATVTTGQVFTSGLWDNGPVALDAWMRNPPTAVLAQSVAQSLPSGKFTPVAFDLSIRDNYGGHAAGSGNNYNAKAPGAYFVQATANIAWTGAAGKVAGAYLVINNAVFWAGYEVPAGGAPTKFALSLAAVIPMAAGDSVQLQLFHNAGTAVPTGLAGTGCRMSARWIGL